MTFNEIRNVARKLEIPDFDVLDLSEYVSKLKSFTEPTNCVIFIPHKQNSNTGHFVGCFRMNNGTLNYQDSYGQKVNPMPTCLRNTHRKFIVSKPKYQSYFSNNCGWLSILHLYTGNKETGKDIDPCVSKM